MNLDSKATIKTMNRIKNIELELLDLREELKNHDIYKNLKTIQNIRTFTENHIFAVWDFMSILKSLQRDLTNVNVPWFPKTNTTLTRFINEIVVAEESDLNDEGEPKSHFEMYIDAMHSINANTVNIDNFIKFLNKGISLKNSLEQINIKPFVADFVRFSYSIIQSQKPYLIASTFTFGREDIIPDMFIKILKNTNSHNSEIKKLIYYFDRHIEIDGNEHGPLSLKMVSELCGEDNLKWSECLEIAKKSIEKRIALWDGINKLIMEENKTNYSKIIC